MTTVAADFKQETRTFQDIGTALNCDDDAIVVGTDQGVITARRALSCLVKPEAGDRVLLAGSANDVFFIIAVLERPESRPIAICMPGDCSLKVSNGRLSIAAENGINLHSPKTLGIDAAAISMRAVKGRFIMDKLSYIGSRIYAYSEKIRIVSQFCDTVVERIAQRFKRSYRVVDEIDHVRSKDIDYRAGKNFSLRGQNTLIDADDLLRLEGDQIHLG